MSFMLSKIYYVTFAKVRKLKVKSLFMLFWSKVSFTLGRTPYGWKQDKLAPKTQLFRTEEVSWMRCKTSLERQVQFPLM